MDEFSFVEMITLGQSKISSVCFYVWCESGELGGRKTFRGRLTQVVETFSDRVAFRIRSNIPMELLCKKQPTALAPRLFPQKSSTTDFRPDSKFRSDWRCCESVAAGLCTRKWLRLDQTMKNLTSDDLGMRLVVIQLGVTWLKKTRVVYLLHLLEGQGDNLQCDLVRVEHLQMIGWMVVMLMAYSRVLSVVLVLWGVGPIFTNGYGI